MGDEFVALAPAQRSKPLLGTAGTCVPVVVLLATLAGLTVATLDVRVTHERPAVAADLTTAHTAAARIPAALLAAGGVGGEEVGGGAGAGAPDDEVAGAATSLAGGRADSRGAGAATSPTGARGADDAVTGTATSLAGGRADSGGAGAATSLAGGRADSGGVGGALTSPVPHALLTGGGAGGGVGGLEDLLGFVAGSGGRGAEEVSGFRWWVAGTFGVDPGGVSRLRREGREVGLLAAAARPLAGALGPLQDGDSDPDRLDDLARGVSRYTTAAVRVNDPGVPALERAALATGLLPTLSGADGPRTWALCPRSGRCTQLTLTAGRVTHRRTLRPGARVISRRSPASSSISVVVESAESSEAVLFGDPEPGAVQHLDARAVYRLLLDRPAAVTSDDPEEQAAIDQLGG